MKPALDYLKRTGYRLPTEAEWEYLCRANSVTSRFYGSTNKLLPRYAWYQKNTEKKGEKYFHRVGQKLPNPWGLCDMHGNAWEWCQDWYGEYNEAAVDDPNGPSSGDQRVLRGGSFFYGPVDCRSAGRYKHVPNSGSNYIGFRVLRTYD